MSCCCTADKRIIIVRKNDTDFNNGNLVEFNITSDIYNVADFTAELILGDIKREFDDLSSGVINFNLSKEETGTLPYGNIDGVMNFIDSQGRVATISSIIPFRVVGIVENDAIKTSDVDYTINVEQGGQNIFNIDVKTNVSVRVGTVETLPAGSSAYVENVGTPTGLVLNFGIPRGENGTDGQSATVNVGTTQTLPTGQDAYVENVGTESAAILNFGIPRGEQGEKGEKGNDATINGYNSISLLGSNGVSISQNGSETIVSGETLQEGITNINALIPEQTSVSNQLADKNFVNSSVQTATANFRGNWDTWANVPTDPNDYPVDYAGNKTPTINDYLVVRDASDYSLETLEGTWRFKYSGTWSLDGKSGWLPEYQVNETPLTAAQLAALNSGATSTNISQITTNQNAIGNLNSLSTTTKTDLVEAVNEVNTTASAKVADVQLNSTSIVNNGIANVPISGYSRLGVSQLYNNSYGLQIDNNGGLTVYRAQDADIEAKTNSFRPIVSSTIDKAVKTGITTNTITLTDAEKKAARDWQGVVNGADMIPDFDSLTPIETHTFDISSSSNYYEVFSLPNTAGTYDNSTDAQFEVWCRIITTNTDGTSTTPRIYQELDCVFREFGSSTQVIYGVILSKPESVTAASTGIQTIRSVCPKAINSGKQFAVELKAYNNNARTITVQVYKTAQYVEWKDTAVASTYDSNHQTSYSVNAYNVPGYVFLGSIQGTISSASSASTAGYITNSLAKTLASSTLRNTGYVITGNSLLFKIKGQALLAGIQNTGVAIDTDFGICQAGTTAAATATTTYTYTNYFQKHQFTPASSVNFAEAYENGDMLYARFTLSNGEIYSDDICSKYPIAGHTWYCIGMATSSSAINFDNTESYFFTLDSNGKLTHINGREIGGSGGSQPVYNSSTNTLEF